MENEMTFQHTDGARQRLIVKVSDQGVAEFRIWSYNTDDGSRDVEGTVRMNPETVAKLRAFLSISAPIAPAS